MSKSSSVRDYNYFLLRAQHCDFAKFFSCEDGEVLCNDEYSVMAELNIKYDNQERRLFIVKVNLKAVISTIEIHFF